jgi:hypothetical protein
MMMYRVTRKQQQKKKGNSNSVSLSAKFANSQGARENLGRDIQNAEFPKSPPCPPRPINPPAGLEVEASPQESLLLLFLYTL